MNICGTRRLAAAPTLLGGGAERRVFHRTVGRIFESDIFMKINRLCRIQVSDLPFYEECTVPCHAPKSVGAAARRRVLAKDYSFYFEGVSLVSERKNSANAVRRFSWCWQAA